MSSYLLKYKRGDSVKYISHLDFVRMFHRTVRRAGLLMEFSQGFNPHPIMTVAMPLSVGVTSDCEFMKIGFQDGYSEDEIKNSLNIALPDGFEILKVKKTQGKEYDLSKLDRAEYIVNAELENDNIPDIDAFLKNSEITVMKKSKSGVKPSDIRPHIHSIEVIKKEGNILTIRMLLDAGNIYNLKPETVTDAINEYQKDVKIGFISVHRNKILACDTEYLN